jgi:pimeloyl-ACP methyl ester carboxylesterase
MNLRNGFTLGEWAVYPLEGRMERGDETCRVQPKCMDVLNCLAQSSENVVEREELLRKVWGERAVSDEPLTRCIADLRRALGESPRKPEFILTVPKRGYRLLQPAIALPEEEAPTRRGDATREILARQKVQFCTAHDGVRIAYATVGGGPLIVKAANWLSHLELDWDAPIWSPIFRRLAQDHQVVRYDERGNGLSDWDIDDISFDAFVTDLETVVDAIEPGRFALLGISQGAAVSIEYAIRHPDRVSHLILFGGYAAGWRIDATDAIIREREAVMTLTATGWGRDDPAYRQIFSSTFMPSATADELSWFNEFQRRTTSPENAVRFLSAFGDIDVRHHLKKIAVPTLVIHALGDRRIPVQTGRDIAATIPSAEFVALESDGHLLLGRELASQVFVDEVRDFIARR